MTPRKPYIMLPDEMYFERRWTPDLVFARVWLTFHMHTRWARTGIGPEEACQVELDATDLRRITGKKRIDNALKVLTELAPLLELSWTRSGNNVVSIFWPNYAKSQAIRTRIRAEVGDEEGPPEPNPDPDPDPEPEQKREGARSLTNEAVSRTKRCAPPLDLEPAEIAQLEAYARRERPEVADRVPQIVKKCLEHHRGQGSTKADWVAECRKWIQTERSERSPGSTANSESERARAERIDRENELRRLAIECLIRGPDEEAFAEWEAAGQPREPAWWDPEGLAPCNRPIDPAGGH